MYQHGLIKEKTEEKTFSIRVHTFYKHYNSSSDPYSSSQQIDLFKKEFITEFDQIPEEELKTKLDTLAEEYKNKELYDAPLASFASHYDVNSVKGFYRSVSDYCYAASLV
ncbi:uncharacterized protein LOC100165341 isoform X1 [Acyrthosiphon pisum]|uniref:Uncharacterized protein n=1 Tax=Acyrthosiphon pisum TaxID=7029 RepID=A0A8R2JT38_ACYPI|nr:uncharacterized protein LOC100165341 isoform X1 [Acyrthosiphon pisum]